MMYLPALNAKRKQREVKFVKYGTQSHFAKKRANNITADVSGGISITPNVWCNLSYFGRAKAMSGNFGYTLLAFVR